MSTVRANKLSNNLYPKWLRTQEQKSTEHQLTQQACFARCMATSPQRVVVIKLAHAGRELKLLFHGRTRYPHLCIPPMVRVAQADVNAFPGTVPSAPMTRFLCFKHEYLSIATRPRGESQWASCAATHKPP